MITLLSKFFVKDTTSKEKVRGTYGKICGIVGIILNILLFAGKFVIGFLSHSIAITADAFNNLSDAGSSVVTLVGFKLSEQKADDDHPFGHGRIEYVSAFLISLIILVMAVELIRDSIHKILHPQQTNFSMTLLVVLFASILIKLYMTYYNYRIGKKIASKPLLATSKDSLCDSIATAIVLLSIIAGRYTELPVDGICGVVVGLFILYTGLSAAKDTIDPLLGQKPEPEYVEKIVQIVRAFDDKILGYHDLIVHDYGPGRRIISLHVEVSSEESVVVIHEMIDALEEQLSKELGCMATIHMDPICVNDQELLEVKEELKEFIKCEFEDRISMHDFRIVRGEERSNLIFDIVVPFRYKQKDEEVCSRIKEQVKEIYGMKYNLVIHVDKPIVKE